MLCDLFVSHSMSKSPDITTRRHTSEAVGGTGRRTVGALQTWGWCGRRQVRNKGEGS